MKRYYIVVCQLKDGSAYTDLTFSDTRENARKQTRKALKCGGYRGVIVKSTKLFND